MSDTMLSGDPRRYGCTSNHFIVKETLTLPAGKTLDEMISQWFAEGKLERVQDTDTCPNCGFHVPLSPRERRSHEREIEELQNSRDYWRGKYEHEVSK